jgi:cell division protein ZapA (FtsZ GTPase activity inhibitor)
VKQTVSIEIAGAKYRVTTDADPTHLERLATAVNARVAELGPKAMRTASPTQLLALVAIGLAEDLERSESKRTALENATRRAVTGAIDRIDRRLSALESDSREPGEK